MTTSFKFDVNSAAAKKLTDATFDKLKEIWQPHLSDDSVARYAVALVAKGQDRKKVLNNLKVMIGEDVTNQLLDWMFKYVRLHREALTAAQPVKPTTKATPSVAAAVTAPAGTNVVQQHSIQNHQQQQQQQQQQQPEQQNKVQWDSAAKGTILEVAAISDATRSSTDAHQQEQQPATIQQEQHDDAPAEELVSSEDDKQQQQQQGHADKQDDVKEGQRRSRVAIQWHNPGSSKPGDHKPEVLQRRAIPEFRPTAVSKQVAVTVEDLQARRKRFGLAGQVEVVRTSEGHEASTEDDRQVDDTGHERGRSQQGRERGRSQDGGDDTHHQRERRQHSRDREHAPRVADGHNRAHADAKSKSRSRSRSRSPPARKLRSVVSRESTRGPAAALFRSALKSFISPEDEAAAQEQHPAPRGRLADRRPSGDGSDDRAGPGSRRALEEQEQSRTMRRAGGRGQQEQGPAAGTSVSVRPSVFERLKATNGEHEAQPRPSVFERLQGDAEAWGARKRPAAAAAPHDTDVISPNKQPRQGPAAAAALAAAGNSKAAVDTGPKAVQQQERHPAQPQQQPKPRAQPAVPTPTAAAAGTKVAGSSTGPSTTANAAGTDMSEMGRLKRELRRMEAELVKMKGGGKDGPGASKAASAAAGRSEVDRRSIVLQNVHFMATEQVLHAHFSTCGDINRITILRDRMSGMTKGIAYVEFTTEDACRTAFTLSGSMVLGRPIFVAEKQTMGPVVYPQPGTSKPAPPVKVPAGTPGLAAAAIAAASSAAAAVVPDVGLMGAMPPIMPSLMPPIAPGPRRDMAAPGASGVGGAGGGFLGLPTGLGGRLL